MMDSGGTLVEKKILLTKKFGEVLWFIKHNIFITILILLVLYSVSYPLFRTLSYFNYFKINSQTLLDGDTKKILASSRPQYSLIERINRTLPEDSLIMVFRMADFAFYGERNYISYVDEKIAGHVLQKTPDDVLNYLLDQGITHVYIPSYPLPSLYNSKLDAVLSSPQYSELLYNFAGYKLFRLLSEKGRLPLQVNKIIGENFILDPKELSNWSFQPDPKAPPSTNNGLLILGDDKLLSNPKKNNFAFRGSLKYLNSPFQGGLDYNFSNEKTYIFNAEVEGNAYVEAYIIVAGLRNGKVFTEKKSLWSGVLIDKKREIGSQFIFNSFQINRFFRSNEKLAYRLIFEVKNGEYMRVNNWSISEVSEAAHLPFQVEQKQMRLFDNAGWKVANSNFLFFELKNLPILYGLIEGKANSKIFINALDSRRIYLSSPSYYASLDNNGKKISNYLGLDPLIKVENSISFFAQGEGAIMPSAQIMCLNGNETTMQITPLPLILSQSPKEINLSFISCAPQYIKLNLAISPDDYSIRKFGKTPASLTLQNLSMKIQFINSDGEIDFIELKEIPFAIEYIKAN